MGNNYPKLFSCFVFLSSLFINAQKPMETRPFEISLEKNEAVESFIEGNNRIDKRTKLPIALYNVNFELPVGTPEAQALFYLEQESKTLGISKDEISNLQHYATRTSRAGSVVRYRQYFQGLPVNKAEVTIVISPSNKVVMVQNGYKRHVNLTDTTVNISQVRAKELAYDYLNVFNVNFNDQRLMVYNNNTVTKLTYEVIVSGQEPMGEWHVFVDAKTGAIFKVVDEACYYHEHGDKKDKNKKQVNMPGITSTVDGTGLVFNPDPLSSNQVTYGTTGYVDGNDANTTQLNNARFAVTLNDITLNGGIYSLVGPRAEIIDFDAPSTGLFTQASSDFSFTREEQGFEAVNTYYHIDYMMNYVNNILGVSAMPYQYSGGVRFDPHGANGADQSYYQPGAGRLSFGEGCVDDGEDSDVIHHELGHGLHDWVTSGSSSALEGLGEGSGDYVAQSYNRGLGYWQASDPQYNWVFNWDGHNACWNGRSTAYGASYPDGLVGQIHTDGQIWATCLMGIWDQIGQQEMDLIFYEGLAMTNGSSNQNDAANAVYQAAINLNYSNSDLVTIHTSLTNCGYTLPALPGPPVASFRAGSPVICLDTGNTISFIDETSPAATSWLWTFEGGSPSTSTSQNPVVSYASEGVYDVTLEVTNSYGTDTITLTNYITVLQGDNCPACLDFSNTTPITISPVGAGNSYTSIINYSGSGEVTDINVTIDITHTWDSDLVISLTSPTGTVVVLSDSNGGSSDNYTNTIFDQEGTNSIVDGFAPFTGTFVPEEDLSSIYGEEANGDWVLTITDNANQDGGQLNSWNIEVCTAPELSVRDQFLEGLAIYPNPTQGDIRIRFDALDALDKVIEVFDIRGRIVFRELYADEGHFDETIHLDKVMPSIYLLKISSGNKQIIKKIVVK